MNWFRPISNPEVAGWPAVLEWNEIRLRPLAHSDGVAWREVRHRNADWLRPWDPTPPPGSSARPVGFAGFMKSMNRQARAGACYPFALDVDSEFAGQLTVAQIVRGSAQFATLGYWLDHRHAGRGVMPRAVAMAIDHCFTVGRLHRIEIAIRPENSNSLRVVEKLGLREVGYAPAYLHIDGQWCDHRLFAITVEECPEGVRARVS